MHLLYGSLTDFSERRSRLAEVAKEMGLNSKTVFTMKKRFVESNFNVIDFIKGNRQKCGRPRLVIGSPAIEKKLLNKKTLMDWAHLNIAKRCELIEKRFKVKTNVSSLNRFYKKSKLGYRATSIKVRLLFSLSLLFSIIHITRILTSFKLKGMNLL